MVTHKLIKLTPPFNTCFNDYDRVGILTSYA
jgi:hypothetical protein